MKNKEEKKIVGYISILVLWFLSIFSGEYHKKFFVFIAAFAVTTVVLYGIKKEWAKLLITFAVTVATSIYDKDYLIMVMPTVLLLFTYEKNRSFLREQKNEQKNMADTFITISSVVLVLQAVYITIRAFNDKTFLGYYFFDNLKVAVLLLIVFVLLATKTFGGKKDKMKKEILGRFKMIYSFFIFETVLLTVNYTTNKDYVSFQSPRLNLIFLFWVIVIFFATGDPFLGDLFKSGCRFVKKGNKL